MHLEQWPDVLHEKRLMCSKGWKYGKIDGRFVAIFALRVLAHSDEQCLCDPLYLRMLAGLLES